VRITLRNREFYDVKEASRLTGHTGRWIRYHLERGKLEGVKLAGTWLVPGGSLRRLYGRGSADTDHLSGGCPA